MHSRTQSLGEYSGHGVLGHVLEPGAQFQGEFPRQRIHPHVEQGVDVEFQLTVQTLCQIHPQPLLQPGQGRVQLRLNEFGGGLGGEMGLQRTQTCVMREVFSP